MYVPVRVALEESSNSCNGGTLVDVELNPWSWNNRYVPLVPVARLPTDQFPVPNPGLPFAIAEAGFWTGIILLIVLCGVTDWYAVEIR